MRQVLGLVKTLTPTAAAPVNDPANRLQMSSFTGGGRCTKYLLKLKMTGGGAVSADIYLWARPTAAGDWGPCGENDGRLNGNATLTGTTSVVRYYVIENLGAFDAVYLEARNAVGSPVFSGELSEIVED